MPERIEPTLRRRFVPIERELVERVTGDRLQHERDEETRQKAEREAVLALEPHQ